MAIQPKDFDEYGYYKYVAFEDGSVLFGDYLNDTHRNLADTVSALPIGAGTIKTKRKAWIFGEPGSMTLRMAGNCQRCEDAIKAVLGPDWTFFESKYDDGWEKA